MLRQGRPDMRRIVREWRLWLVAVLCCSAAVHAQPRFAFDTTPGILPKDVVPSEYRLALSLDPGKERFDGEVDIALQVRRRVDAVVLNAFELTAADVVLTGAGGERRLSVTDHKA